MSLSTAPDPRELVIARGHHKGNAFVCVGILRERDGKRMFVSSFGEKVPWSSVTKWDYLHDVAKEYDIWAPDGTLFYMNPQMGRPCNEPA